MSTSSSYIPGGTIESASAFFSSGTRTPSPHSTAQKTPALSEKNHSAMTRRLEQLQAALGEGEIVRREPAPPLATPTPSVHAFGTSSLLVTGLLSAMLGAGAMWLAKDQHEPSAAAPQASYQNVATLTPVVPTVPDTVAPEQKIPDGQQVTQLLEAWRSAWQSRDVASYLKAYSADFSPADGNSREAWVVARQKKLATGAVIDIQISDLRIERVDNRQFKASFLQDYVSGNYREIARRKTLLIAQDGDEWKIAREWQE